MFKGRKNQLTKQTGEYLVCAELSRRGLLSTPFSGNIPDIDILSINEKLKMNPIQVKAISSGDWQYHANDFLKIQTSKNIQTFQGTIKLRSPKLIWIFVFLKNAGTKDEFYICQMHNVQDIIKTKYSSFLKRIKGKRPRNPESTHGALSREDLKAYKDKWEIITK
jgi:hypothetical protein